jgi:hypothetical protein
MVMNCDLFQENASRFMDGLLDASDQAALFAHLSTCPDCRSFLSSSVRVREVVRKDAIALPPGIDEAFFEQLLSRHATGADSRRRPETFWRRDVLLSVPLAAAALLLVVLASVLFSLLFLKTGAGEDVRGEREDGGKLEQGSGIGDRGLEMIHRSPMVVRHSYFGVHSSLFSVRLALSSEAGQLVNRESRE